ncbi:MMPL family transporter [Actinomadura oligospora]|uniref:MMPL family transporter n=1 Tax=Actinomadura oligospora TaxID=111804 RepID=UPI00047D9F31|nr:MMPL family transporter [Actinomadura oligospora]
MDRENGVTRFVCGRWSKWVVLVVWLLLTMMVAGPLAGKLTSAENNDYSQWLPGKAEATRVLDLQKRFQTGDDVPSVVVYERTSGITPADRAKAEADARALAGAEGVVGKVAGPIASSDGKALQTVVPIKMGKDGTSKIVKRVDGVKKITGTGGAGMSVHLAGMGTYLADTTDAYSGLNSTQLLFTVLVVVVILLFAYRSPVLWILPFLCAMLALTGSQGFIYLLAKHAGLTVNAQDTGFLLVLVFGAGTDYALLLLSRYREELRRHEDRHTAMAVALRRAAPPIVASAATVSVALLCLQFAQMNNTAGLGPVLAIGIAVGLVISLTLMPALLVIFGRWIFWPRKPKVGSSEVTSARLWARAGTRIARRPRAIWIGTAVVLGFLSFGIFQMHATGLASQDAFLDKPQSVVGQEVIARHFAAGQNGQPVVVIGNAGAAPQLRQALSGDQGIVSVTDPVQKDGLVYLEGTLRAQPDTQAAFDTVSRLRTSVHGVSGADAKVGGQTALTKDTNSAYHHDTWLLIPLVLVAVMVILTLLLRALVAPLLLIGTVVLSYLAALGISSVLFHDVFGFKATDTSFPLLVFVFLVSLGVDYNIFLMTRVREDAQRLGTRRAALSGLTATGGVITSAGLVLAGTFAVLTTVPVISFIEIGAAVSIGILLDTFVVRSVLVTALTLDMGRFVWLPGRLAKREDVPVADAGDIGEMDLEPAPGG